MRMLGAQQVCARVGVEALVFCRKKKEKKYRGKDARKALNASRLVQVCDACTWCTESAAVGKDDRIDSKVLGSPSQNAVEPKKCGWPSTRRPLYAMQINVDSFETVPLALQMTCIMCPKSASKTLIDGSDGEVEDGVAARRIASNSARGKW